MTNKEGLDLSEEEGLDMKKGRSIIYDIVRRNGKMGFITDCEVLFHRRRRVI